VHISFDNWTQQREIPHWGSNSGAKPLAFQQWRKFKEAFPPEIVKLALSEADFQVTTCIDPFGGSGTTPLACQFLGVHPIAIEVNPYLSDLIECKLSSYDVDSLLKDFSFVIKESREVVDFRSSFAYLPATFIEPGVENRWIFDANVASRIASMLHAISKVQNPKHQLFFKVLLGGMLIEVSNVSVNGKGRRYRRGWEHRRHEPQLVDALFSTAIRNAIVDIYKYSNRKTLSYTLLRGDARAILSTVDEFDLAVFSPPYPNSFDYTDVYNVELWMLGYLSDFNMNRDLRKSTLTSHVQIQREYGKPASRSTLLEEVADELSNVKELLWNKRIPEMVEGYFFDMEKVLVALRDHLRPRGSIWAVVGDSKYANIDIKTGQILAEIAGELGLIVTKVEPFRSMRTSAQQGGKNDLLESLLVFAKH
jgi:DNA modification methylase